MPLLDGHGHRGDVVLLAEPLLALSIRTRRTDVDLGVMGGLLPFLILFLLLFISFLVGAFARNPLCLFLQSNLGFECHQLPLDLLLAQLQLLELHLIALRLGKLQHPCALDLGSRKLGETVEEAIRV